jgi:hypothetical protein
MMSDRVLVDYGPHRKQGDDGWELHLQMGPPGSPRFRFESAWKDEFSARGGAKILASTFRDDTTYIVADSARKVVAVKFIHPN